LIALILRTSPEQASSLIVPNIIVVVISAALALYICRVIYRLAISQIRSRGAARDRTAVRTVRSGE